MIRAKFFMALFLLFVTTGTFAADTDADTKARALFELFFEESVSLSPMWQTDLGRKTNYDKWDDISPERSELYHQLNKDQLARLKKLDKNSLNPDNQLSYELQKFELEKDIAGYKWRDHNYPVNQMFGLHAGIPAFLINSHNVASIEDADAYVARLAGVGKLIDQLIDNLQRRADKGILAPAFVYPYVLDDSRNIIKGQPFDDSKHISPLLEDFTKKVEALKLDDKQETRLLSTATHELQHTLKPAYQRLIKAVEGLQARADSRDGAWKLPQGKAFYNHALERMTTTTLSADAIHKIGLAEVARIRKEMEQVMKTVKFDGDLQAFFTFVRDDPQFYYPDSDAGRAQYLQDTRAIIDAMKKRLPELFGHLPQADLIVKAVEPFREKSAGKAFYNGPAPDGSRPGTYYVNLYDMSGVPRYQMEALAYHEALPGHHMQIAIAQEMKDLPSFRRHGGYTAYIEGWGLYAELVPRAMGFYADPYSDFGRLAMELWRAVRLVVDTGIHSKKWTREQAIDYFVANSPMNRADATREIERYIVMPGQATTYKIGMNKFVELRDKAKRELGEQFDLRAFHDFVLGGGALPLTVLEHQVDEWIRKQKTVAAAG